MLVVPLAPQLEADVRHTVVRHGEDMDPHEPHHLAKVGLILGMQCVQDDSFPRDAVRRFSAMDQVFAGIAVIIARALISYPLMRAFKRHLYPWETQT